MIVIGLIVSAFGIGFLCWLIFTLAVYALPFFAGITVGLALYHSGAGVVGAPVVGFAAGAVTLIVGRFVFAVLKLSPRRGAIAFLFAALAAIAGYHATLALAQIGVPSTTWREAFAIAGAMFVGGTALVRMSAMATLPVRRLGAVRWLSHGNSAKGGPIHRHRLYAGSVSSSGPPDQRSSGAASSGADRLAPPPSRTIERQSGGYRCAAFRSGCETSLLCATDSFSTLQLYDLLF